MMSATLLEEHAEGTRLELMSFTVDQVQQMLELEILNDGDPFELIDGLLVCKDRGSGNSDMSHAPIHARIVAFIQRVLDRLAEQHGRHSRCQLPIFLNETNAPEPDIVVAIGTPNDIGTHPRPADIELIVEVSDTSLRSDRTTKQRLLAAAGIPAYWIVNLRNSTVEIYQNPDPEAGTYQNKSTFTEADSAPVTLAGKLLQVPVKSLFGR
jgi:Uma2 family endonuclease